MVTSIFEKVFFDEKDITGITELLVHDKKNESGKVQFVLLDGIGNAIIDQLAENTLIINAFRDYHN